LDEKLLRRSDGTSVYMTQDLGTAQLRFDDFHPSRMIYVVGKEQNYDVDVLTIILENVKKEFVGSLYHLSYGMVELPQGRMKSREGTIVDADDLIREMQDTARDVSSELGKLSGFTNEEKDDIFRKIGMGALKYYILKVDPKKNMTFNPSESIDFNGNTGPFIQYTYARIKSVFRKGEQMNIIADRANISESAAGVKEIDLIRILRQFPEIVSEAAKEYSPAIIANYCYDLAKEYNQFYHDFSILGEENQEKRNFRLVLSDIISEVLHKGMWLLGIEMPERM
jgi:arginyl-tRNA synthetase